MLLALILLLTGSDTLSTAERAEIRGAIVFVSERDGTKDVRLIQPTGARDRVLIGHPYDEYPAAVAPDGAHLAVVATRDSAGRHYERLSIVRLADGSVRHYPLGVARARNPSWSPDGRWLAVESDLHGFADVLRVPVPPRGPVPSGAARRLTHAPEGSYEPAVSPRGDRIAFVTSRDGDAEVYVMRADGSAVRRLTAFHRDDWGPVWAPDGRTLAFLSARQGVDRIFLVRADGTATRALNPIGAEGKARRQESSPAWSPDGNRIAYVTQRVGERARIWVTDLRTGERRALTDGRTAATDPAWSPDGRYLAFTSDRVGDAELYLMRADGSGQTRLTRAAGADWLPRWIPEAVRPAASRALTSRRGRR